MPIIYYLHIYIYIYRWIDTRKLFLSFQMIIFCPYDTEIWCWMAGPFLLSDSELTGSCFCTASLQAHTTLCDGRNRCCFGYTLWILDPTTPFINTLPLPLTHLSSSGCRFQECIYSGTLCQGPNQGCAVHYHKVSQYPNSLSLKVLYT